MPTKSTLFRLAAVGFLGLGVGLQICGLAVPTWAIFTVKVNVPAGLNETFDQQVGPYSIHVVVFNESTNNKVTYSTWEDFGKPLPVSVILTRILSLVGALVSLVTFIIEAYMVFSVLGNNQTENLGPGPGLASGRLGLKTHAQENAYVIFSRLSWIGSSGTFIGAILWIRLQYKLSEVIPYNVKDMPNVGYGFIVSIVGGIVVAIGLVLTKLWLRFT